MRETEIEIERDWEREKETRVRVQYELTHRDFTGLNVAEQGTVYDASWTLFIYILWHLLTYSKQSQITLSQDCCPKILSSLSQETDIAIPHFGKCFRLLRWLGINLSLYETGKSCTHKGIWIHTG